MTHWFKCPNEVWAQALDWNMQDRAVLSVLFRYQGDEGWTTPIRMRTIAKAAGCSVATVKRSLRRLVEIRCVEVERRPYLASAYRPTRPQPKREDTNLPYHEYIQSEAWKERARAAKRRAKGRCQLCNSDQHLNAHHRTYERLGAELPEDITVLCDECHERHSLKSDR